MKQLITPAVLFLSLAACAADVGRVIVRQQWPWSTDIKVEFELSNVTDPVDISLKAYNGAVPYDQAVVDAATSGSRFALSKGGVYTVTLDPSVLFASGTKTVPDFKVMVTATAAEKTAEVLYKIVNLESPYDVTDVTRGALLNGEYGAIETKYSDLDPAFKNVQPADMLIWTGVTNNPAYKTTHLVLRKINSAGKSAKYQNTCIASFTYDFFIGVFEVTQAQFAKVCAHPHTSSNETNPDYADYRPVDKLSWDGIRGKTTGDLWPAGDHTSLDSGKFLYILQKRTGLMLDLPTATAWEYACRGGNFNQTSPELYTGEYSSDAASAKIMRCRSVNCVNTGSHAPRDCDLTDGPAWVGSYLPNAYGLYDMLGNVREICLDHIAGIPTEAVTDYRGPAQSSWSNKRDRVLRGGSYMDARNSVLVYTSQTNTHPEDYDRAAGIRLCLYPDAQPQPQE